jgi:hypothetical protein
MVDIGNRVPSVTVLSQASRWVSSRIRAPSVPVISTQVPQLHRDRFFQEHVLAGFETVARDRVMVLLRRGADIDHGNVRVLDDVLVVERRGCGPGERLYLGEAIRADFADVQLVHQRGARQRFRADAPAPTGADHCDFDLLHALSPLCLTPTLSSPRKWGRNKH